MIKSSKIYSLASKLSNLSVILILLVATTFNSCADKSIREQTVKDVMGETVTTLYKTMSGPQLDSLTDGQVIALFNHQEKKRTGNQALDV